MSIFITGTGTDVGKTYVSGEIVKKLREKGINCGYYKPVLSGAEKVNGRLIPGDCEYVMKVSGLEGAFEDYVSYMFEPAVSPHLVAQMANVEISIDKIKADYNRIQSKFNYVVVEGAGGITCPLKLNSILMSDVIKALNLEIIIVADSGLGTINSTLLTVEYAKQQGIGIKGIILNRYDKTNPMHLDNKKSIEILTGIEVIEEISCGQKKI